jgi:hypothetical protein
VAVSTVTVGYGYCLMHTRIRTTRLPVRALTGCVAPKKSCGPVRAERANSTNGAARSSLVATLAFWPFIFHPCVMALHLTRWFWPFIFTLRFCMKGRRVGRRAPGEHRSDGGGHGLVRTVAAARQRYGISGSTILGNVCVK